MHFGDAVLGLNVEKLAASKRFVLSKCFSGERICLKKSSSSRQRLQHLCPNILADHGFDQTRSSQGFYKRILWDES